MLFLNQYKKLVITALISIGIASLSLGTIGKNGLTNIFSGSDQGESNIESQIDKNDVVSCGELLEQIESLKEEKHLSGAGVLEKLIEKTCEREDKADNKRSESNKSNDENSASKRQKKGNGH